MDNALTEDIIILLKFRAQNPNHQKTILGSVGIKACIAFLVIWLAVPIITVKENSHVQGRDESIWDKTANFILLAKLKAHHLKKGITQSLQFRFISTLNHTAQRAIFNSLMIIRWLDTFLSATVCTNYGNSFPFSIFSQTLRRAEIGLADARSVTINHLATIGAGNHAAILSLFRSLFSGITGSTSARTIIALPWLHKITWLLKGLAAKIAGYNDTLVLRCILARAGKPPAFTRAIHLRFASFPFNLKCFTAVLASKCFDWHSAIIA